ncbi:hypothetical protein CPB83DRAFT_76559 [Crepidotus variabilis]|uniref:Cytochrome b561 domain-containing protein n=1 Tax=Crepidotus variabilis TaxID=179855 RepID=A0A9P6EMM3_9AGAR|nr:hypothetical protein CPB83DRAFT_76559 [Crepidotus variabilis]
MFTRSFLLFWLSFVAVGLAEFADSELYPRQQSITGDSTCGTFVCVKGTVNGSTTSYVLSSRGGQKVGWMAIGYGNQMTNTPMVIMWMNSDGTATLSQRKAPDEVMPTVDSNPPRKATFDPTLSLSVSNPTLAFNIPSNNDKTQQLIYALGTTNPGSSKDDATLIQHLDYGIIKLDLTKVVSATPTGTGTNGGATQGPTSSDPSDSSSSHSIPLLPYQRMIIAHAVFCGLGFLIFLPAGALLARYMRTFVPGPIWFRTHAILQFAIAGPMIIIGIILGISAVNSAHARHLNDAHKRWGIAIFVLYLAQCGLGAFIHWVKKQNRVKRPPQNYIHAVFGLAIIAFSGYQVNSGYSHEWPTTTGRGPAPPGVNIFFWIWIVILAVAYTAGLALLPKQYRQEREVVHNRMTDYDMKESTSRR